MPQPRRHVSAPARVLRSYRRDPAANAAHVAAIALPLAIAIVTLSVGLPLVLFLIGEAFVLGVLPRLAPFRRYVDERRAREAKLAAAVHRATVMARLSPDRSAELERCEALVAEVRARSGCEATADEASGLDALLAMYVRLAVAQGENTRALEGAGVVDLESEIAALERRKILATPAVREWLDRRIEVLTRRRSTLAKASENAVMLACAIATVVDLIRSLRDECLAAQGTAATREAAEVVPRAAESVSLVGELAVLRAETIGQHRVRVGDREVALEELELALGLDPTGQVSAA